MSRKDKLGRVITCIDLYNALVYGVSCHLLSPLRCFFFSPKQTEVYSATTPHPLAHHLSKKFIQVTRADEPPPGTRSPGTAPRGRAAGSQD